MGALCAYLVTVRIGIVKRTVARSLAGAIRMRPPASPTRLETNARPRTCPAPVRIVIADHQMLFREGLRTHFLMRPNLDIVGKASDGDEAIALVETLRPSVVLMDVRMPRLDRIQATARIHERWPSTAILVLTTFDDDANLFGALPRGRGRLSAQ
jgi:CheY-like chemotaxis protein